MILRVWLAIFEGTFWAGAVAFILWLTLPEGFLGVLPLGEKDGLFSADFGRRWDGGCDGWTKTWATIHLASDLLLWWAYVTISFVLMRLHPILKSVPTAKLTLVLMCSLFICCGGTHLLDAYTTFYPIYRVSGLFRITTAVVSMLGAVFIAYSLVAAFAKVMAQRQRTEQLEKILAQRR